MIEKKGHVYWLTGLSGAGKTTIANELVSRLRKRGKAVVLLDGDELRSIFLSDICEPGKHTLTARYSLAMQYSRLCKMIASQGVIVVIATISLFKEVFEWNRTHLPGYFEIYLKVPLNELRRRDSKGIYKKFDMGILKDVTGLDLPFDEPSNADLVVEYRPGYSGKAMADDILLHISEGRL